VSPGPAPAHPSPASSWTPPPHRTQLDTRQRCWAPAALRERQHTQRVVPTDRHSLVVCYEKLHVHHHHLLLLLLHHPLTYLHHPLSYLILEQKITQALSYLILEQKITQAHVVHQPRCHYSIWPSHTEDEKASAHRLRASQSQNAGRQKKKTCKITHNVPRTIPKPSACRSFGSLRSWRKGHDSYLLLA
jgi:hypothetical protein